MLEVWKGEGPTCYFLDSTVKNSYPVGHEINHQMNKIANWLRLRSKIIAQTVNGIKVSESCLRLLLHKEAGGLTN